MPKKIIFGLMLAFVGVIGFQFDASASPMCTDFISFSPTLSSGSYICKYSISGSSVLGCSSDCESDGNACTFIKSAYSNYTACSCNKCKAGTYRSTKLTGIENTCRDNVTYQPQTNIPTFYTCNKCSLGTYSNGGTATSCTPCPSNTYGGGGDSSSCKSCPTNATCSGTGNKTFTCKAGYYTNTAGTGCTQCPLADDIYTNSARTSAYRARYTSAAGATSVNDCYLSSGTTYYDAKGTFTFDAMCNYE